jgi:hypothetical protein
MSRFLAPIGMTETSAVLVVDSSLLEDVMKQVDPTASTVLVVDSAVLVVDSSLRSE